MDDRTEEAPGIGIILISLFIHSLISTRPGSEILGVPASEIREIVLPSSKYLIISSVFFFH